MSAIPRNLLPETAEVGPDGVLQVGGCSLADVAAEFGTPVFVYDESALAVRPLLGANRFRRIHASRLMDEEKLNMKPYPQGSDCVWLASDEQGHLGAFITAGVGPIPAAAFDSGLIELEDIEGRLCQLPLTSHAQLLVSVKRPDDFIDLAERGFFVYDWTDVSRTTQEELRVYELVAVPTQPLNVGSLPPDLATVATVLRLSDLVFAAGSAVDVRAHLRCVG